MKLTDISAPDYFHKVVDCQWACPAHTPVPEYIRLIAAGRYSDAYKNNKKTNVFPGVGGPPSTGPASLPAAAAASRPIRSRSAASSGSRPTTRTTSAAGCPGRARRTASGSR
ncbi:MAG: hypothetical protein M5U07_05530 [Xanthobacteraceae bacterium]|nr:hypothetical protein [Xanthobacteraceae bacterium]